MDNLLKNKLAISVKEFAQAFSMTTRQVYGFLKSENIQTVKIGKVIYIPRQAILNYVKSNEGGDNASKNQQGKLNISG